MLNTHSLWKEITPETAAYPQLNEDIEVDVVIIGGGITGMTAAVELIDAGKKVAVLEARRVGEGTTGFSTGNLYIPIQPYYQKVFDKFDLETVRLVAQSRKNAIDYIESKVIDQQIRCNFVRRPMFLFANKAQEIKSLDKEQMLLKEASIDIAYTETIPLSLPFKKAVVLENQARFNPLQYTVSLAHYVREKGGLIFENSRVLEISEKKSQCLFKTAQGRIVAKNGIIATHTPTGVNHIQFFTAPYRSYAVAVELKDEVYPEINAWSIKSPHYALSTHSMSQDKPDLLVAAGSHHKTGQAKNSEAHFNEIEQYLKDNFKVKNVQYRWSAQHYHAADSLPYIGLASHYKNIYEATGFFADGLVYGTVAGILLSDKILSKENALGKIYNTRRNKLVNSLPFLIKENLNIFLQYMKDMPSFSVPNFKKIKKGEGKIVTIKGEKCGAYRDEQEQLHLVSAVCTHMKCIVQWNNAERTWDCPCHGSRFSYQGKVLEGPARLDLAQKSEGE